MLEPAVLCLAFVLGVVTETNRFPFWCFRRSLHRVAFASTFLVFTTLGATFEVALERSLVALVFRLSAAFEGPGRR